MAEDRAEWRITEFVNADERLGWRVSELAKVLGVSRSTAYELVAAGEIPSIELGGITIVPVAAAKARLAEKLAEKLGETLAARAPVAPARRRGRPARP